MLTIRFQLDLSTLTDWLNLHARHSPERKAPVCLLFTATLTISSFYWAFFYFFCTSQLGDRNTHWLNRSVKKKKERFCLNTIQYKKTSEVQNWRPRTLRERKKLTTMARSLFLASEKVREREKRKEVSSSSYDDDEKLIHLQRRKIEINECKLCVMAAKKMIIRRRRRKRCPMNEDDRSAWEQAFWAIESEKSWEKLCCNNNNTNTNSSSFIAALHRINLLLLGLYDHLQLYSTHTHLPCFESIERQLMPDGKMTDLLCHQRKTRWWWW